MRKNVISILGCGWLGKAVGKRFVDKGWHVFGSTTTSAKLVVLQEEGITPCLLQMDPDLQGEKVNNFLNADVLMISIPPRRKAGLTDVYLAQMKSLSDVISKTKLKRIIFISSTAVYDDVSREVFESDANPESYLFKAEQYFLSNPSFRTTVLRFGGLIGSDRHPGRFLSGKENIDGAEAPVNMVHQRDCVNIVEQIVDQQVYGEVFNACADVHPTKQQFYNAASKLLGLPPPLFSERKDSPFKIVNAGKLKSALGYEFEYPDPMRMY